MSFDDLESQLDDVMEKHNALPPPRFLPIPRFPFMDLDELDDYDRDDFEEEI